VREAAISEPATRFGLRILTPLVVLGSAAMVAGGPNRSVAVSKIAVAVDDVWLGRDGMLMFLGVELAGERETKMRGCRKVYESGVTCQLQVNERSYHTHFTLRNR